MIRGIIKKLFLCILATFSFPILIYSIANKEPFIDTFIGTVPIFWTIPIRIFHTFSIFSYLPTIFVVVFVAITFYLLINKTEKKRHIWHLFFGYFFFYLLAIYAGQPSMFQRILALKGQIFLEKNSIFFLFNMSVLISFVPFLSRYLLKKEIKIGDINIGEFFLLLFPSVILFEALILNAPVFQPFYIFLKYKSAESIFDIWGIIFPKDLALEISMISYYLSFIFALIFSSIDYLFLETKIE